MKIICFGDSLTTCGGENGRFSDILQDRFPDHEFINSGVGGETFVEAMARIESDVIAKRPDIVLVEYGANDWWRNERPFQAWTDDLDSILSRIRQAGARPVVLGVFGLYRDENGQAAEKTYGSDERAVAYRSLESEIAARHGAPYVANIQELIVGRRTGHSHAHLGDDRDAQGCRHAVLRPDVQRDDDDQRPPVQRRRCPPARQSDVSLHSPLQLSVHRRLHQDTRDHNFVHPESLQALPPVSIGELLFAREAVIPCYYNQPERLEESLVEIDGRRWFRTGDLALVDDDGFFFIKGRSKDMIIVGGENVYASEVEGVLQAHPGIVEAAVRGAPATGARQALGEVVEAFVVARDPDLTEKALRGWCFERLASFKVPAYVRFRDALPRNPAGKVLKADLG